MILQIVNAGHRQWYRNGTTGDDHWRWPALTKCFSTTLSKTAIAVDEYEILYKGNTVFKLKLLNGTTVQQFQLKASVAFV